jgi:prolyl 4-hydroxylase
MLSVENRCPLDPEAPVAWKPGQVNEFFRNITTSPDFAQFEPHILSRPEYAEGDNSENAEYILGPWVVMFDNFISEEEAKRLIELGRNEGYKRSSDVGQIKYDGKATNVLCSARKKEVGSHPNGAVTHRHIRLLCEQWKN